jgi:hypothetical protein
MGTSEDWWPHMTVNFYRGSNFSGRAHVYLKPKPRDPPSSDLKAIQRYYDAM